MFKSIIHSLPIKHNKKILMLFLYSVVYLPLNLNTVFSPSISPVLLLSHYLFSLSQYISQVSCLCLSRESHEDLFSITATFKVLQGIGGVVYNCKTKMNFWLDIIDYQKNLSDITSSLYKRFALCIENYKYSYIFSFKTFFDNTSEFKQLLTRQFT